MKSYAKLILLFLAGMLGNAGAVYFGMNEIHPSFEICLIVIFCSIFGCGLVSQGKT